MLNPDSPIPLYRQLADLLLDAMRRGEYPPGARIPSEPQLARDHGIGRPTVRQAVDLLVRKGLLVRRRGSGTYVQQPEQEVDLFSLAGTSSAFQKKGIDVEVLLVDPTRRVTVPPDNGNPFAGGKAFFLSRLSRVAGTPVLFEEIYLHPVLFAGIDEIDLTGRSLSLVVETRFYMRPTGGRQTFRITRLDAQRARLMNVTTSDPALMVQRTLDFARAKDAVFSILYCNTDHFVFSQRIGGLHHE